jgi:hypothetical protein
MVKKWKIPLVMIVAAALIAVPFGSVLAQEVPYEKDRDPGAMAADLVFARPVGLAAIVAGTAVFLFSIPFSLMGGNTGQAWQKLVIDPTEYTFHRPLGEF